MTTGSTAPGEGDHGATLVFMLPPLTELLDSARVVSLPMRWRFRGIDTREALLLQGPSGWSEFSPFVEYAEAEAATWLRAAIDFGWQTQPKPRRDRVRVNATVPAVGPDAVPDVLARFPGCRTAKVKVADPGQSLADDVARVRAVRDALGSDGRIRVDANGLWNLDEAERAIHALAEFDLEYVEQPCLALDDLAEIRERVAYMGIPIAADESVRKADDPFAVVDAGAADILVVKAQPLGGVSAALDIVHRAGLPAVVSSALDTSVGLAMGAWLAACMPSDEYDCGLATASLLDADVTDDPVTPVAGGIPVRRVEVDERLVSRHAADAERTDWWRARLERCYGLLDSAVEEADPAV